LQEQLTDYIDEFFKNKRCESGVIFLKLARKFLFLELYMFSNHWVIFAKNHFFGFLLWVSASEIIKARARGANHFK